jgi:hypothetical protein
MAINFPTGPLIGQLYSYSDNTWQWSGDYWGVYSAQTGYITSAYTVGDGYSVISGITGNNLALKSFSGTNIGITSGIDKLTFEFTGGTYLNYLFAHGSINPADTQTYYIGNIPDLAPVITPLVSRSIIFQKNGVIESVSIMAAVGGTVATGVTENSTFIISNVTQATTRTITTTFKHNTSDTQNTNFILSTALPVNAGDYIQIRWTTPTWVINPTAVRQNFNVILKLL